MRFKRKDYKFDVTLRGTAHPDAKHFSKLPGVKYRIHIRGNKTRRIMMRFYFNSAVKMYEFAKFAEEQLNAIQNNTNV